MRHLILFTLLANISYASLTLSLKSLTTQNEYVTTYSGSLYLKAELEVVISTDDNIAYVAMGVSHYNNMGLYTPYGGLVEEYDFTMSTLSGATIYGHHNMFPQDHYIPAGATDETLMYVPILISETNDDIFCIQYPDFKDLDGNSLTVNLSEESCITMDDLSGLDSNVTTSDKLIIRVIDLETREGIENAQVSVVSFFNDTLNNDFFTFDTIFFTSGTDDSGYVFIEDFPLGMGFVDVYNEEYFSVSQQFTYSGSEQITIEMQPYEFISGDTLGNAGTISGTVAFELDINSFITPFIFAIGTDSSIEQYDSYVSVDGSGSYELALVPGDYVIGSLYFSSQDIDWTDENIDMNIQLQFYENSLAIENATVLQISEGDMIENINFDFINSASLGFNGQLGNIVMGQVTSNNETNMESTVVSVLGVNGQVISEQTIDYNQNFSLTGLNQNQDYILLASHSEYGIVEKEFSLSSMVTVEDIEFDLSIMSSKNNKSQFPGRFNLSQNFPNPFNPVTEIKYEIPGQSLVNITIYDLVGRKIKSLVNQEQSVGSYLLKWDATNSVGEAIPAGIYIYTIQAGKYTSTKKMILLK